MAQSLPDITITNEWQSVDALTQGAIAVGAEFRIIKKGRGPIIMWEGTEPEAGSFHGEPLTDVLPDFTWESGSLQIWVRAPGTGSTNAHVALS